jgi:hypothetical protein
VRPAHERLQRQHPPVRPDDRLVLQHEPVGGDGGLQLRLQLQRAGGRAHDAVGGHRDAAAALPALHVEHGGFGEAQQVGGADVAGGHRRGEADRRRHVHRPAVHGDHRAEQVGDEARELVGAAHLGVVRADHHELVAGEPRRRAGDGQVALQPSGQRDEQVVARLVAEGGVDALEVVEAAAHHGDALVVGLGEQPVEQVEAGGAVGQAGELVDGPGAAQQLRHPPPLRDVGDHHEPLRAAVVGVGARHVQLAPDGGAVGPHQRRRVDAVAVLGARRHRPQPARVRTHRRLGGQRDRGDPPELLGAGAQQRAEPGVGRHDPARGVQHGHADRHHRHEVREALRLPLRLAHVAHDTDDAERDAVGRPLDLGPAGQQHVAGQVHLEVIIGARRARRHRRPQRLGLPPLHAAALRIVRVEPDVAVELLQRVAPREHTGVEVEAPRAQARQAFQLRGPRAVHAPLRAPGTALLDQRDDGQLTIERAEPNDADSHRVSVGSQEASVTVGTGENL